jgi:hypothetical protein
MSGSGLLTFVFAALCWWLPDLITAVATAVMYAMAISQVITGILIFMG